MLTKTNRPLLASQGGERQQRAAQSGGGTDGLTQTDEGRYMANLC